MIFLCTTAIVLGLVIIAAAYLQRLQTEQRHADIERLRDEYADATRGHQKRTHIHRSLVSKVCEELSA